VVAVEWLIEKLADYLVTETITYLVSGQYSRDLASMPGAADAMIWPYIDYNIDCFKLGY